ncbi:hypothetical protein C6P42_003202 [Pichia californica]|nr:hypothetical protein C6P42_003202 [[Candida] californica]
MQKSISEDSHTFNIENIHGIDNLNDLHLNQLNSQLRYELRNLSTDVDVELNISGDEADYGDEIEDVDDNEGDEEVNEYDAEDVNYTSDINNTIRMKRSNIRSSKSDHNTIEHALGVAFSESESEPFKKYIKSIVDRGHKEINGNNPTHSNIPIPFDNENENDDLYNVNDDGDDDNDDEEEDNDENQYHHIQSEGKDDYEENKKRKNKRQYLLNNININGSMPVDDKVRALKKIKIQNTTNNQISIENNKDNSIVLKRNIMDNQITSKSIKSLNGNDSDSSNGVKKCSRCRMKRLQESSEDLEKYQTCMQCRERRKVRDRKPRVLVKLPNLSDDWKTFISKVELNNVIDLQQHNYRAYTDISEFPRFQPDDLTTPIMQAIGEKIVVKYIHPLQDVTGFKFAVRDHHNPSLVDHNRAKKITWMFICSQDKFRRRKSRSENKRQVSNRLKTEECCSKITLSYDLVYGIVQISYNHKHHNPLKSEDLNRFNGRSEYRSEPNMSNISRHNHNYIHSHNIHHQHHHHHHPHHHSHSHSQTDIRGDNSTEAEDINRDGHIDGGIGDESLKGDGDNENKKIEIIDREVVEAAAAAVAAVAASRVNEEAAVVNSEFGEHFDGINIIGVEEEDENEEDDDDDDDVEDDVDDVDGVNVGVDVGVSVSVDDVDIDVDDVAEIAKLLKQVQQAQSRRLSELEEQQRGHRDDFNNDNEEHDESRDDNVNNNNSDDDNNNNNNDDDDIHGHAIRDGQRHQEERENVGDVRDGDSHFLINQSLLEQVREQVGSSLDGDEHEIKRVSEMEDE